MESTGGNWRMATAMVLAGTIGLFVLASGQPPLTVVLVRCLIGGAALLAWHAWRGQWQAMDLRAVLWLLAGGMALVVNWLSLFSAYRLSSVSVATLVYHVQPFILVLLAATVQRELPRADKLATLLLAFAGVVLTSGIDLRSTDARAAQGALLALAAAFLYALNTLATRKISAFPPAQVAGLQLLLGAVALFPLAGLPSGSLSASAAGSLALLGIVHTALMYLLMYGAYQRLRADAIALLSFIYPLVALVVDRIAFHTVLTPAQLAGMLLIVLALLANQRATIWPGLAQRA
jgi:drug/metabolite transporter (DMT)-like permease